MRRQYMKFCASIQCFDGRIHEPILAFIKENYNIPYVDVIHIFSEMPLLGYFGYIPFGVLVWQVFIWSGKMFNFNTEILIEPVPNKND